MFTLLPVGGARRLAAARLGVSRAARDYLRCRRPPASPGAHAAACASTTTSCSSSSSSAPAAPAAACDLIVPAPQEALERALAGVSADFPLNLESDWLAPEDTAMVTMVSSPWDCTMCNFEHTGRSIHRAPQHMHDYIRADLVDHVDFDLHEFGLGLPMRFGLRFDDSIEAETAKYNAEAAALFRPSRPTGDEPACRAGDEDPPHAPLSEAAVARMHALWRQQAGVLEARVGGLLAEGRLVGVLGGDHMSSFGAMRAFGAHCAARGEGFGLLQFDAHADLYDTFEQLQCSHACIIKRVLEEVPALESVVAVGIREMGPDEVAAHAADPRHRIFSGADLRRATGGDNSGDGAGRWGQAVRDIVAALPRHVWVTFDIDGLDLSFCPGTGTPVPGGLSYNQAVDVLLEIHRSGRVLCGWDLVEVGSGPAAVNVGARLANKLAGLQLLGVGARDHEPLQLRGVGGADGSAARE